MEDLEMIDFVLHGYCQKCNSFHRAYRKDDINWDWFIIDQLRIDKGKDICLPICEKIIPFLSTKQMEIIWYSKEYTLWWSEQKTRQGYLWVFLEEEPFLVAEILKKAEEGEVKK